MGISRKTLIAVAAVLAVVLGPHMLAVIAFAFAVLAFAVTVALALLLNLHLLLMLALALALSVAVAVALVIAWRIDFVTMRAGWTLVPTGRAALR